MQALFVLFFTWFYLSNCIFGRLDTNLGKNFFELFFSDIAMSRMVTQKHYTHRKILLAYQICFLLFDLSVYCQFGIEFRKSQLRGIYDLVKGKRFIFTSFVKLTSCVYFSSQKDKSMAATVQTDKTLLSSHIILPPLRDQKDVKIRRCCLSLTLASFDPLAD